MTFDNRRKDIRYSFVPDRVHTNNKRYVTATVHEGDRFNTILYTVSSILTTLFALVIILISVGCIVNEQRRDRNSYVIHQYDKDVVPVEIQQPTDNHSSSREHHIYLHPELEMEEWNNTSKSRGTVENRLNRMLKIFDKRIRNTEKTVLNVIKRVYAPSLMTEMSTFQYVKDTFLHELYVIMVKDSASVSHFYKIVNFIIETQRKNITPRFIHDDYTILAKNVYNLFKKCYIKKENDIAINYDNPINIPTCENDIGVVNFLKLNYGKYYEGNGTVKDEISTLLRRFKLAFNVTFHSPKKFIVQNFAHILKSVKNIYNDIVIEDATKKVVKYAYTIKELNDKHSNSLYYNVKNFYTVYTVMYNTYCIKVLSVQHIIDDVQSLPVAINLMSSGMRTNDFKEFNVDKSFERRLDDRLIRTYTRDMESVYKNSNTRLRTELRALQAMCNVTASNFNIDIVPNDSSFSFGGEFYVYHQKMGNPFSQIVAAINFLNETYNNLTAVSNDMLLENNTISVLEQYSTKISQFVNGYSGGDASQRSVENFRDTLHNDILRIVNDGSAQLNLRLKQSFYFSRVSTIIDGLYRFVRRDIDSNIYLQLKEDVKNIFTGNERRIESVPTNITEYLHPNPQLNAKELITRVRNMDAKKLIDALKTNVIFVQNVSVSTQNLPKDFVEHITSILHTDIKKITTKYQPLLTNEELWSNVRTAAKFSVDISKFDYEKWANKVVDVIGEKDVTFSQFEMYGQIMSRVTYLRTLVLHLHSVDARLTELIIANSTRDVSKNIEKIMLYVKKGNSILSRVIYNNTHRDSDIREWEKCIHITSSVDILNLLYTNSLEYLRRRGESFANFENLSKTIHKSMLLKMYLTNLRITEVDEETIRRIDEGYNNLISKKNIFEHVFENVHESLENVGNILGKYLTNVTSLNFHIEAAISAKTRSSRATKRSKILDLLTRIINSSREFENTYEKYQSDRVFDDVHYNVQELCKTSTIMYDGLAESTNIENEMSRKILPIQTIFNEHHVSVKRLRNEILLIREESVRMYNTLQTFNEYGMITFTRFFEFENKFIDHALHLYYILQNSVKSYDQYFSTMTNVTTIYNTTNIIMSEIINIENTLIDVAVTNERILADARLKIKRISASDILVIFETLTNIKEMIYKVYEQIGDNINNLQNIVYEYQLYVPNTDVKSRIQLLHEKKNELRKNVSDTLNELFESKLYSMVDHYVLTNNYAVKQKTLIDEMENKYNESVSALYKRIDDVVQAATIWNRTKDTVAETYTKQRTTLEEDITKRLTKMENLQKTFNDSITKVSQRLDNVVFLINFWNTTKQNFTLAYDNQLHVLQEHIAKQVEDIELIKVTHNSTVTALNERTTNVVRAVQFWSTIKKHHTLAYDEELDVLNRYIKERRAKDEQIETMYKNNVSHLNERFSHVAHAIHLVNRTHNNFTRFCENIHNTFMSYVLQQQIEVARRKHDGIIDPLKILRIRKINNTIHHLNKIKNNTITFLKAHVRFYYQQLMENDFPGEVQIQKLGEVLTYDVSNTTYLIDQLRRMQSEIDTLEDVYKTWLSPHREFMNTTLNGLSTQQQSDNEWKEYNWAKDNSTLIERMNDSFYTLYNTIIKYLQKQSSYLNAARINLEQKKLNVNQELKQLRDDMSTVNHSAREFVNDWYQREQNETIWEIVLESSIRSLTLSYISVEEELQKKCLDDLEFMNSTHIVKSLIPLCSALNVTMTNNVKQILYALTLVKRNDDGGVKSLEVDIMLMGREINSGLEILLRLLNTQLEYVSTANMNIRSNVGTKAILELQNLYANTTTVLDVLKTTITQWYKNGTNWNQTLENSTRVLSNVLSLVEKKIQGKYEEELEDMKKSILIRNVTTLLNPLSELIDILTRNMSNMWSEYLTDLTFMQRQTNNSLLTLNTLINECERTQMNYVASANVKSEKILPITSHQFETLRANIRATLDWCNTNVSKWYERETLWKDTFDGRVKSMNDTFVQLKTELRNEYEKAVEKMTSALITNVTSLFTSLNVLNDTFSRNTRNNPSFIFSAKPVNNTNENRLQTVDIKALQRETNNSLAILNTLIKENDWAQKKYISTANTIIQNNITAVGDALAALHYNASSRLNALNASISHWYAGEKNQTMWIESLENNIRSLNKMLPQLTREMRDKYDNQLNVLKITLTANVTSLLESLNALNGTMAQNLRRIINNIAFTKDDNDQRTIQLQEDIALVQRQTNNALLNLEKLISDNESIQKKYVSSVNATIQADITMANTQLREMYDNITAKYEELTKEVSHWYDRERNETMWKIALENSVQTLNKTLPQLKNDLREEYEKELEFVKSALESNTASLMNSLSMLNVSTIESVNKILNEIASNDLNDGRLKDEIVLAQRRTNSSLVGLETLIKHTERAQREYVSAVSDAINANITSIGNQFNFLYTNIKAELSTLSSNISRTYEREQNMTTTWKMASENDMYSLNETLSQLKFNVERNTTTLVSSIIDVEKSLDDMKNKLGIQETVLTRFNTSIQSIKTQIEHDVKNLENVIHDCNDTQNQNLEEIKKNFYVLESSIKFANNIFLSMNISTSNTENMFQTIESQIRNLTQKYDHLVNEMKYEIDDIKKELQKKN